MKKLISLLLSVILVFSSLGITAFAAEEVEPPCRGGGKHSYFTIYGEAPTCKKEGLSDYKHCTVCGYTIEAVVLEKTVHADVDKNGYCDICGYNELDDECSCICHSDSTLSQLVWKILKLLFQALKLSPYCICEKPHYYTETPNGGANKPSVSPVTPAAPAE